MQATQRTPEKPVAALPVTPRDTAGTAVMSAEGDSTGVSADADIVESIARLAYVYWEQRGHPLGSSDQDWFRAEDELRNQRPSLQNLARSINPQK